MAGTHLGWSIETADGKCPDCGEIPLLVYPHGIWNVASSDIPRDDPKEDVEVGEEVSGHFCPKCRKLVSLSLNVLN